MQNTYSVHVEYKTYPFLSIPLFCPCNATTLSDGMFNISICILILEIETDMSRCSSISLPDFHSPYKA